MKPLATILVSVLVSAASFVAMQLWVAPHLPVASVEAASLTGMTVAQARALAESRGLRLVLDEERPNDKVAPGTICEQRPLAGSMLRRGDELHAAVARRGDTAKIPRTAGMTPAAARELIERAQLRVGESTTQPDAQTPAGLVIGSSPGRGQRRAATEPGRATHLVGSRDRARAAAVRQAAVLGQGGDREVWLSARRDQARVE